MLTDFAEYKAEARSGKLKLRGLGSECSQSRFWLQGADTTSKRILIADDSTVIRRQIRMIVEFDRNIEVCAEACDGVEAVEKARECRPDLAVLDLVMPRMNGLEAAREIKKVAPTLPVLLFTLHASRALESESKRAGVDAVVAKTAAGSELSKTIQSLLR
jgi:DNA-binding NarL/FixJ family response regulator